MFFRRQRPKPISFEDRLENLKRAGFILETQTDGRVKVSRNGCAAIAENTSVGRAGIILGDEIASLVDAGYQKFFQTPAGKRKPALASELKALHKFLEDLRETLGAPSLYNEALGTVSKSYLYDRVQDRDTGVPKRAWERE